MTPSPFDAPSASRVYPLSEGRKLGFAEDGGPDGAPVFYFHGFPGLDRFGVASVYGDIASFLKSQA